MSCTDVHSFDSHIIYTTLYHGSANVFKKKKNTFIPSLQTLWSIFFNLLSLFNLSSRFTFSVSHNFHFFVAFII